MWNRFCFPDEEGGVLDLQKDESILFMNTNYQYKPSTLNMNGKQEVVGKVTQGTKSYKALFQTALGDDAHYWLASHCIRNGR